MLFCELLGDAAIRSIYVQLYICVKKNLLFVAGEMEMQCQEKLTKAAQNQRYAYFPT